MYICIYECIIIKNCDNVSSNDISNKQLNMTCVYITINKTDKQNFVSGERWNLFGSPSEQEQKRLYWNPQKSRSGHQLKFPPTWFTISNESPCLQRQNIQLNLSNLSITSPFKRKLYMHWLAFFSVINK